jgi:hypothetical protein
MDTDEHGLVKAGAEGLQAAQQKLVTEFHTRYDDAESGLRRVLEFGLFCFWIKEEVLKHGQFLPWLEANCPDLKVRSIQGHMAVTKGVLEAAGFQIRNTLRICPRGHLFLLADGELTDEQRAVRTKADALIEGKTARQLMLAFKEEREGKRPHHPRKELSPIEREKAEREHNNALLQDLAGQIGILLEGEALMHADTTHFNHLFDQAVRLTTAMRAMKPNRNRRSK